MNSSNAAHHATVDIGSNGVRTAIVTASPHPRLLRTLYANRIPISLHDAQFASSSSSDHNNGRTERQPIPQSTIDGLLTALRAFRGVCTDFCVPEENVHVLATEATRSAINSTDLTSAITRSLRWGVRLLSQTQEAAMGALGIAASVPEVHGLCLDLGGGSLQLTYVNTQAREKWWEDLEDKGISLQLGAAALMKRIGSAPETASKMTVLKNEVGQTIHSAVENMESLQQHFASGEKLPLYVSGGGFRGWGYLLMSLRDSYPVSWINGYTVTVDNFFNTARVGKHISTLQSHSGKKNGKVDIFGVSKRRLQQLPAITLVVEALASAFSGKKLGPVTFCQGGTPLGVLFSQLSTKQKAPLRNGAALHLALSPFPTDTFNVSERLPKLDSSHSSPTAYIAKLLLDSLPTSESLPSIPTRTTLSVIPALATSLNIHQKLVRDIRTSTALRFSLTGDVGGTLGISHFERAALALMLVERWGGRKELQPSDLNLHDALMELVGGESWWCQYLGRVAAIIGLLHPAVGVTEAAPKDTSALSAEASQQRLAFSTTSKGHMHLLVEVAEEHASDDLGDAVGRVQKLGKKFKHIAPDLKIEADIVTGIASGAKKEAQVEVSRERAF